MAGLIISIAAAGISHAKRKHAQKKLEKHIAERNASQPEAPESSYSCPNRSSRGVYREIDNDTDVLAPPPYESNSQDVVVNNGGLVGVDEMNLSQPPEYGHDAERKNEIRGNECHKERESESEPEEEPRIVTDDENRGIEFDMIHTTGTKPEIPRRSSARNLRQREV